MTERSYRVVQWSTGGVGALAVAAISGRPDLELVGVWVHSPAKVGRDAGELAGIGAVGVRATSDVDEVLALTPDCFCYTASGESRPTEAIDDFCRNLEAGINVVTTSVPGLLYPAGFDATQVARIEDACRRGKASLNERTPSFGRCETWSSGPRCQEVWGAAQFEFGGTGAARAVLGVDFGRPRAASRTSQVRGPKRQ